MKKSLLIIAALACVLTACDPNKPESLYGTTEKPAWTAPAEYDYTASMTIVAKVDLKTSYPGEATDFAIHSDDLLAAFSGDRCLGIASPQEGLFFLYVAGTEGDITLRYYSAQYKNLFVAEPIPFLNDANLGSVAVPFEPGFTLLPAN